MKGKSHFQPFNTFCRRYHMVIWIPWLPTLLLTPIMAYMDIRMLWHNVGQICHKCHFYQKCYKWRMPDHDIWTLIYANMGVKRSVRTLDLWLIMSNVLKKWLESSNMHFSSSFIFLCIFSEFPLYNWWALSKVDIHSMDFLFMFSHSVSPQKLHLGGTFFIFPFFCNFEPPYRKASPSLWNRVKMLLVGQSGQIGTVR